MVGGDTENRHGWVRSAVVRTGEWGALRSGRVKPKHN